MTPEAAVRNPCLAMAKRAGFVEAHDDLNNFFGETGHAGVHKRMHFGHGAANGWPDDLFLFRDGHHWWVEFKGEDGEATAIQKHTHGNIGLVWGDVSVINSVLDFGIEFAKRLATHAA